MKGFIEVTPVPRHGDSAQRTVLIKVSAISLLKAVRMPTGMITSLIVDGKQMEVEETKAQVEAMMAAA